MPLMGSLVGWTQSEWVSEPEDMPKGTFETEKRKRIKKKKKNLPKTMG